MDELTIRRFWEKVDKNGPTLSAELGPCWIWSAFRLPFGYGRFKHRDKCLQAHRFSFLLHNPKATIDGWDVLHRCDNPSCVNPEHLFLGTDHDNSQDKVSKRRHGFGETHSKATLAAADVLEMRRLRASGVRTCDIARQLSVKHCTVTDIVLRRTWRHLP